MEILVWTNNRSYRSFLSWLQGQHLLFNCPQGFVDPFLTQWVSKGKRARRARFGLEILAENKLYIECTTAIVEYC